jgi:hypothetical protein
MTESWDDRNYNYLILVNEEIIEDLELGFGRHVSLKASSICSYLICT